MSRKLIYLTAFVLVLSLTGKGWSYASNPIPDDGAIHADTWASLNWCPGDYAVAFDIYFGENYDDVKNGTPGAPVFQGNQNSAFFIVGFPGFPYPDGLVPGTTYYWRIDEINDRHQDSPWTGDVWSFRIPSSKAYAPEPADGAEFVDPNVSLGWEPGFRAKIHTIYFGDNYDTVNNASGGIPMRSATWTPGQLESGKTYYWRIDEFDTDTTHKGDVWSFTVGAGILPDGVEGTIYVDAVNGDDNNNGSTPQAAFATIQRGVDAAPDGSTVLVAPGYYEENIIMKERVHLRGSGPSVTFISGEGKQLRSSLHLWAVIWAADHSLLEGFTITVTPPEDSYNRYAVQGYTEDRNDPIIANNVFMGGLGNELISFWGGSARIVNNTFFGNQFQHSLISVNNHLRSGIPVVANNIFVNNQSRDVVGAHNGTQPEVSFNMLWDNRVWVGFEDFSGFTPGLGNKWENPCFIDPASGNLRLSPSSPAIDAGDNDSILPFLPTDMPGNSRIVNGTIDMGAYESGSEIASKTYYVDADALGNNDGSSWSNAFLCLQDALAVAQYGDEIRVANGIYRPDQQVMMRRDQPQIVSSGEWSATFQLIDGVAIKGGYAGFGEPDPDARDVERYKSILSGDLNADDGPGLTNIGDNSYQVVTSSGTEWTTVLDGFTITGGNADGPFPYNHGGGVYNVEGSPTLIDCTITGNSTIGYGGGMHNIWYSHPTLVNCTISNNAADYGGGIFNDDSNPALLNCILSGNSADSGGGGGICNYRSNPALANCTFIENSAVVGGGMYNEESEPMLSDCAFKRNSSTIVGGGILNGNSNPTLLSCIFSENSAPSGGGMSNGNSQPNLMNCIFSRNSASIDGGGMENLENSHSMLLNCTFSNNFATEDGGGIYNHQDGRLILINCILWENSDQSGMAATSQISGSAEVSYSCVQDSISLNPRPGEGNINTDPLFVDWEDGDYHLKSQAGRWDPTSQVWGIDQVSSPCIDAGDPSIPVSLERFPNGSRINMGAYGGTPEASLSQQQPSPLIGQASNPNPPDGAVGINITVRLSWSPGFDGALHNVYFGKDFDDVSPSNFDNSIDSYGQTDTTYDPGHLDYNQTYYWRIDEVDNQGIGVTGEVWSFTTASYGGHPKGRTCFTANTPVWINGSLIPISQVTSCQKYAKIARLSTETMQIEKVEEHVGTFVCRDIILETGNTISVVDAHCFMLDYGQWIAAQNLTTSLRLKTLTGTVGIKSITTRSYTGKVYNLKIYGSDQYMVGKDLVIVRDY